MRCAQPRCDRSTGFAATCSCSRATCPARQPSCCASSSRPTAPAAPLRPCSRSSRPTARSYGRIVRDARRHARTHRRGGVTPQREELALGEVNSGIYVFRADKLWPALERLEPHNAQGELYLTDTIGLLVGDGETGRGPRSPRPVRGRGRQHARRARRRRRRAARPDQPSATCSPASRSSIRPRPGSSPTSRSSLTSRCTRSSSLEGATRRSRRGAEIHAQSVLVDAEVGTGAIVGPFCYLRPGTVLEADSKAGTFVEIKNSRIGTRREGAAPVVHRRCGGRRGLQRRRRRDHRELPASARPAEGPHARSARTSGPASRMGSSPLWRLETEHGRQLDRRSRRTSRRTPSRSRARARRTRRGMQPVSGTTELVLPGLDARWRPVTDPQPGPLDRARSAEAADGLLRPLAPGARRSASPTSSASSSARSTLETFANGETYSRYDESIRGADLFIVQTGCDADRPAT